MSLVGPVADEPVAARERTDPSRRRLVIAALAVGLVGDIGIRGGPANAVVAAGLVLSAVVLRWDRRLVRTEAKVLAVIAVAPAAFLGVRSSPWLVWSNTVLSTSLLTVAALYARDGSILDSSPARVLRRGASGLERGLGELAALRSALPSTSGRRRDHLVGFGRGLVLVVPTVVVLVALLASADAVFASLVAPDLDGGPIVGHVLLTALFASLVVVLAGAAAAHHTEASRPGRLGVIELTTALGLMAAVLGLFVVSQLVALTEAGDRLVESAGLTPAEYARSGFFQLCWATALLLGFLTVVRALAEPAASRSTVVTALGAAVPGLGLGLVAVSLRRMALYDDAFGLTMLRLAAVGAGLWMGAVLVMAALRNLGLGSGREWLLAGAGAAAVVLIVVANVVDAEAVVARHNLDRARAGAELDVGYLATLSDDVVPVIAEAFDAEHDPAHRDELREALRCDDRSHGVARLNLATSRADELRSERCR